jgi:hypothetical protein
MRAPASDATEWRSAGSKRKSVSAPGVDRPVGRVDLHPAAHDKEQRSLGHLMLAQLLSG